MGPETPVEERPPGRGRGSSVALLVGYLIGISHVDPLKWDLTLERFISEDMTTLPDIDLDFPRGLRDELIERVHCHFGPEYAVLTGAITTYKVKGTIQDLGKALGLPQEHLSLLSKQLHSHDAADLRDEMAQIPDFRDRVDAQGWRDLLELAPQLMDAPKGLSQHVGGMVLSSSPLPEMVPMRAGAMDGRYIMDWNKDSVADARVRQDRYPVAARARPDRGGARPRGRAGRPTGPDISRIDPEDANVYDMINADLSKGGLPAPVSCAAQDGATAPVAQPARPRIRGRPYPARCRRPRAAQCRSSSSATATGRSGSTTICWRPAPWSVATGSSSGRSRSSSSSRTWQA